MTEAPVSRTLAGNFPLPGRRCATKVITHIGPNPDYERTTFEGPTFDFNVVRTGSWAVTLTVTDRLGATDTTSARVFSRFEFRDNLNGTATNNQTSLMWQLQDDGNQYTLAEARGLPVLSPGDNNGLNVCGDLSLAGFNDWRVPTLPEAQSVLDFTRAPIPFASALLSTTRSSSLYISNSWIPNSMADYISSEMGKFITLKFGRARTFGASVLRLCRACVVERHASRQPNSNVLRSAPSDLRPAFHFDMPSASPHAPSAEQHTFRVYCARPVCS